MAARMELVSARVVTKRVALVRRSRTAPTSLLAARTSSVVEM